MKPDYSNIPLQNFFFKYTKNIKGSSNNNDGAIFTSKNILFEYKNFEPKPEKFSYKRYNIVVLGSPIYIDEINKFKAVQYIIDNNFSSESLEVINGEFVFIFENIHDNSFLIINDRFTSIPIYYHSDTEEFLASFSYNYLWNYLKNKGKLKLRIESFYEMILFRRVFGDKTFDSGSRFMPSSSILSFSNNNLKLKKYWEPDFKDYKISLSEASEKLAKFLKNSIKFKTSDNKKSGLFLSGGFDTRTILAAFNSNPVCFTATYNKKGNREYEVANELANLKSSDHFHLKIAENHFSNIFEKAVAQVGGFHQANSIFMGYRNFIRTKVDVLFHGHGFDYMFQGMYLPSSHLKIGRHYFSYKFLNNVPKDIVRFFIDNCPYKLKYPYINDFIKEEYKLSLQNELNENLSKILKVVAKKTTNRYKQLEYLTFHYLSRHYSFSDHWSIHTNAEQRTISFENNIYNLFLKLPVKFRFDRRVIRKSLKILDSRFFNVKHANTNLPMGSSFYQTLYELKKKILKAFKIIPRDEKQNTHLQRTWPTHEWIIRNEKSIMERALKIGPGCSLQVLNFLDLNKINIEINNWLENTHDYKYSKEFGDFVWSLITIETFLEQD